MTQIISKNDSIAYKILLYQIWDERILTKADLDSQAKGLEEKQRNKQDASSITGSSQGDI